MKGIAPHGQFFKQNPFLWWLTDADHQSCYRFNLDWSKDGAEFEEFLAKRPLNTEDAAYFLGTRVEEIRKCDDRRLMRGARGTIDFISPKPPYKLFIRFYSEDSTEEQSTTIIHEIIHIYYRISGNSWYPEELKSKENESLIEREAVRFVRENSRFVKGRLYEVAKDARDFLDRD